jgi:hypothetical protein
MVFTETDGGGGSDAIGFGVAIGVVANCVKIQLLRSPFHLVLKIMVF